MNKNVVVMGGGTGLSTLLRGLKKFPVNITAIVSVSDNGGSTGRLREDFNIPAVGDIRRVIVSLSETESLAQELFNYRFKTNGELNGHTVGNLILTAASEITGNLSDGIEEMSSLFNLKGKVVPLTEDNVTLMGEMEDGTIIKGESEITLCDKKIKRVFYENEPVVTKEAIESIKEADLIILSMGSIYTSIIPNLINKEVRDAIDESNARLLYVSNMVTQPGETDGFSVSNHVSLLNSYLGQKKLNAVVVNDKEIDENILKLYRSQEQKDPVLVDYENLKNIEVLGDDFFIVDNGMIRHDSLKVAFSIFSYLIR